MNAKKDEIVNEIGYNNQPEAQLPNLGDQAQVHEARDDDRVDQVEYVQANDAQERPIEAEHADQVPLAVHGDEDHSDGELSDGEIDRLLESANEEMDYLEERRAEISQHFEQ